MLNRALFRRRPPRISLKQTSSVPKRGSKERLTGFDHCDGLDCFDGYGLCVV
jgi:hypothetical protein